jgi:Na+/melibiose symporter-like transporter
MALVDISFRATLPLFWSTPIKLGGLGLPPSTIGIILSFFGVINGFCQIFFFPRMHNRWGPKKVFIAGVTAFIPLYLLFPVINYLASEQGLTPVVWAVVFTQIMLSIIPNFSFSACFICDNIIYYR